MTVNASGNVVSYDDYYPYGQVMEGRSMTSSGDARYKYTGKERDTETGLDYFGARYYDARIGRWLSVDPLALRYPEASPYVYVGNNPIRRVDADGQDWKDIVVGALDAFLANTTPYQRLDANTYGGDRQDLAIGRVVGDVASFAFGGYEIGTGVSAFAGSGLLAVGTGGAATPLSIMGAGAAVGLTLHGSAVVGASFGTFINDVNVLNENTGGQGGSNSQGQEAKKDPAAGLKQQLEIHKQKLRDYRSNPEAHDNKGLLKNAPNDRVRQQIIQRRIRKLENQIKNFEKQINDMEGIYE